MNLNNINNFEYEQTIESLSQMTKNNILNIMNKQKKFNASDINKILNVFLKIMRELFTETITAFIQAC